MAKDTRTVLISCIGYNDAGQLEDKEDGAILTILSERDFNEVWLLWNDAMTEKKTHFTKIVDHMRVEAHRRYGIPLTRIHDMKISPEDVSYHLSVFPEMKAALEKIFQEPGMKDAAVYAGISSGTPAMQICWVLFYEARMFPLLLVRSIERRYARGGPRVKDVLRGTDILPKMEQWEAYRDIYSDKGGDLFTVEDPTALAPDLLRVLEKAEKIFIHGETGTGKEVLARSIAGSWGKQERMVEVNCGAIPQELIESELFGHEKGAFTGATQQRIGYIEQADEGILFLDEINSMPLDAQVKLLRFLDSGEFRRIGGKNALKANARVLAASNGNIESMIEQGHFRLDLYYRLREIELFLPPLRERKHRIGPLIKEFLAEEGITQPLSASLLSVLEGYSYPGNVRELRLVIRRLVRMYPDLEGLTPSKARLQLSRLSSSVHQAPEIPEALHGKVMDLVKQLLTELAVRQAGSMNKAAKLLGVTHPTVKELLTKSK